MLWVMTMVLLLEANLLVSILSLFEKRSDGVEFPDQVGIIAQNPMLLHCTDLYIKEVYIMSVNLSLIILLTYVQLQEVAGRYTFSLVKRIRAYLSSYVLRNANYRGATSTTSSDNGGRHRKRRPMPNHRKQQPQLFDKTHERPFFRMPSVERPALRRRGL
jgi:hypothetical protein